jgi:hypothetical protein
MLFSQTLDTIDLEIAELLAQVEAKKQHQSLLIELDSLSDNILEQLGDVVSKIKHHAPETMASIKTAVFSLLGGGDGGNGNDGGAKPAAPTLEPESSSEISLLNFLTSDCTTTTDEDDDNPSPIDTEPTQETEKFQEPLRVELLQHLQNSALFYQQKQDGEIIGVYLGCNNQSRINSWSEWLYRQDWGLTRKQCYTSRTALRLTKFKYELSLPALSKEKINQLAGHNFSKQPILPQVKPQSATNSQTIGTKGIKIGSKIVQTLTPSETFEATTEVGRDRKFFAKSLVNGRREFFSVSDVTVVIEPEGILPYTFEAITEGTLELKTVESEPETRLKAEAESQIKGRKLMGDCC